MATASQFDLNQTIQEWRTDLARSPALGAENLDELESHLRDSIATLAEKGLSADEAFLIAARRCGNRQQLQAEFSKPTLFETWLFRLIWIFVTLLASLNLAAVILGKRGENSWVRFDNPFDAGVPIVLTFFFALTALNAFLLRRANPCSHRQWLRGILYWLIAALLAGSLFLAGGSTFQIFCAAWLSGLNATPNIDYQVISAILPAFGFAISQILVLIFGLANLALAGFAEKKRPRESCAVSHV